MESFKEQIRSIFLNQVEDASEQQDTAVAAPARRTGIKLEQHSPPAEDNFLTSSLEKAAEQGIAASLSSRHLLTGIIPSSSHHGLQSQECISSDPREWERSIIF